MSPPGDELEAAHAGARPRPKEGASPLRDERESSERALASARVVVGLLSSTGVPDHRELARARAALARLGVAFEEDARVVETPEALAPRVAPSLRPHLLAVLAELAGDEAIRWRLVATYAALFELPAPTRPDTGAPPRRSLLRWLVGALPRHAADSEGPMHHDPYRQVEPTPSGEPPIDRQPLRRKVARIQREYEDVLDAVEHVILGKRHVIGRVLVAMAARGHVLLVDLPGTGKTQMCKAICAAIEARFGRLQCTPDLFPADITGANVYDLRSNELSFRPGPVFTNLLLVDEINRASPKTQSALLEVMEERSVTVDGATRRLDDPFHVLATMNPLDQQGTFPLPAAQIDRFLFALEIGHPSPDDEVRMLDRHLAASPPVVPRVIGRDTLLDWCETAPLVHVSPAIKRATVERVHALRRDPGGGVSPRATLSWLRAAQARAMFAGRDFVTIEDVLDVAPDVLRHRLRLDADAVRERLRSLAMGGGS